MNKTDEKKIDTHERIFNFIARSSLETSASVSC